MFHAVIVAAVSTPEQAAADRESLPEQLADCRDACKRHGWRVEREIVIPGHSREYWTLAELCADCPEYQELVELVEAEQVNLVVCMRLARLCRTVDLMVQVTRLCTEHHVQVYSVREPQEPVSPEDIRKRRGVRGIMDLFHMALSEEEQQVRVERLHQGMVRRIKAGLPAHSRMGQYGYNKAVLSSDVPTVNEEEAQWVRWMFARRLEGWGAPRIAQGLNDMGLRAPRGAPWSETTVSKILRNPLYRGAVYYGEHINEHGKHEAIVDADTWHRAQAPVAHAYRRNPRALTSLGVCGRCGWRMTYQSIPARGYRYLQCSQYNSSRARKCKSNAMIVEPIEAEVLRVVRLVLNDPSEYERYVEPLDSNDKMQSTLKSNLARVQAAAERWARAYEQGAIGLVEFKERRAGLDSQAETIAGELAALELRAQRRAASEQRLSGLAALLPDLEEYTPGEMNAFLRLIVDKVICLRGEELRVYLL